MLFVFTLDNAGINFFFNLYREILIDCKLNMLSISITAYEIHLLAIGIDCYRFKDRHKKIIFFTSKILYSLDNFC